MLGVLAAILVPIAFVGAASYRVVRRGLEFRLLLHDGVEAGGTVRNRVRFNPSGATRQRYVRYEYTDPSGRTHSRRSLVSSDVWEAAEEGSTLPIVYSASKPSVSAPKYLVDAARRAMVPKAGR